MSLKSNVESLDSVPEAIRGFYEQGQDKKFYLQVEGMEPKAKVDEFRSNNIKLLKDLEAFKDVDPVEYRTLKSRTEDDFKKAVAAATQQLSGEQIDTAVQTRTKKMAEERDQLVNGLNQKLSQSEQMLSIAMIDNSVRAEAAKVGAYDTAYDDLVLRARSTFKLDNMQVVAFDGKGEKLYDKDGQSPLSVGSWLKDLKKSAPHLFKGMEGGGAGGSGGHSGHNGDTSKMNSTQKIMAGLSTLK